uniref:EF-hand domain-containing protein n=1 Tax=Erythrolobus australicus TaxID=1077150 RepID=A0A6T5WPZ8_9RHOD|mmetsp:Transcript_4233/g.11605  ORF Transcript_4233/g.11605 Transcript_4233/m.11605 type:complete len:414 (+) Transcript_4233:218-1459(+)
MGSHAREDSKNPTFQQHSVQRGGTAPELEHALRSKTSHHQRSLFTELHKKSSSVSDGAAPPVKPSVKAKKQNNVFKLSLALRSHSETGNNSQESSPHRGRSPLAPNRFYGGSNLFLAQSPLVNKAHDKGCQRKQPTGKDEHAHVRQHNGKQSAEPQDQGSVSGASDAQGSENSGAASPRKLRARAVTRSHVRASGSLGTASPESCINPATPSRTPKAQVMSPAQEKYYLRTFQLYAMGKRTELFLNAKGLEKFLRHIGDTHTTPTDIFTWCANRAVASTPKDVADGDIAATDGDSSGIGGGGGDGGGGTVELKKQVTFSQLYEYLVEFRTAPGDEQHTVDDCAMIFDMLDKNGNGEIDFEEFRHILNDLTPVKDAFSEAEVKVVFRAINKSGGGTISRLELMTFLSELLAKGS